MRFFVPDLDGIKERGEELYQAIKKFAERWGATTADRIYSISFRDPQVRPKNKPVTAIVGRADPLEGGLVFAIFDSHEAYFVCTTNRGARRGDPLMITKADVNNVEYFEAP
jgi:hypothetical protein